ncbi:heterokaryon incompatibility protein-domain-containing protein, partial [Sphaerosporella brunnea]
MPTNNIERKTLEACIKRNPRQSVDFPRYPTRVIDTRTLEFEPDSIMFRNEYAVLSHTWMQNGLEITYRDVLPALESLGFGMQKLYNALKAARELGYQYLWVDNCCIDKANNTELVEAISSMGDWYYNAAVCLVYIDDYSLGRIDNRFDNEMDIQGFNTRYSSRGWTLQEIVMSSRGVFYDKSWKKRADTAHPWAPMNTLAKLCKVPRSLLCCGGLGKPNVAASIILELAGERRTTRPEDRAYSLMSMLGVHMAPDYGEGQAKALARLFESIISTTGDVSVFNW